MAMWSGCPYAVGSERKDHVRPESPDMPGDCSGGLAGIYTIERTVGITETADLGNAKHFGSGKEF